MPKMKTNRSATKRFRLTATGKIKHSHAYARHKLAKKTAKRKRHLRRSVLVSAADCRHIERLLGL